ncbi:MAG: YbjN domain-containing protein [Oscillospiraceae bacterium]|nr:YbjN domain-containing protein [Oscillospiraceae bacterium]
MFRASEEIAEVFEEHEIMFRTFETEKSSRVGTDAQVTYTVFVIWFISSDDDSDVSVRVPNFVRYQNDDEKKRLLRVVNEMNRKYRYVKFTMPADDECINIEYDFLESTHDVGRTAVELFRRIMQIADESYPEFMKALWGKDDFLGNAVFYEFKY